MNGEDSLNFPYCPKQLGHLDALCLCDLHSCVNHKDEAREQHTLLMSRTQQEHSLKHMTDIKAECSQFLRCLP